MSATVPDRRRRRVPYSLTGGTECHSPRWPGINSSKISCAVLSESLSFYVNEEGNFDICRQRSRSRSRSKSRRTRSRSKSQRWGADSERPFFIDKEKLRRIAM